MKSSKSTKKVKKNEHSKKKVHSSHETKSFSVSSATRFPTLNFCSFMLHLQLFHFLINFINACNSNSHATKAILEQFKSVAKLKYFISILVLYQYY